jgi:hypothetical protein
MSQPPRFAHLATRAVVTRKLAPTYAKAHAIDDEEGEIRLSRALGGALLADLQAAAWKAIRSTSTRLTDDELAEKVAVSVKNRGLRPGKAAEAVGAWSAFLVLADIEAGVASEMARRVFESAEGRRKADEGLAIAGEHLAKELLRK